MNEYDSGRLADFAKEKGYTQTDKLDDIDCYVLNTCHIREKATEKVYSDIGRIKKNFKDKKKPLILVTGCVAQAENELMLKREPYIDAVIGPQSYHNFEKILHDLENKRKKINSTDFDVIEKFDKLNVIKNHTSKVSTFVTIQEGCDKFCNFCVVPYTRGSECSRSPKDIIQEVQNLVSNGAKEVTLLGQNVNAYNYILNNKNYKLSDLIIELNKIKKLYRIRYTTSHPKDMTTDLIDCYKFIKKLMPQLHLPVQSGSNSILKGMNRKHTRQDYLNIIYRLKQINPEIKFSSDFIVGYPGETERDFEETMSLVKKINFINSYSFIYSPRPGTPAANFKPVDKEIQKKRLISLQNLLEKIQKNKNQKEIGKFKEILVENKMKNQNQYFGRMSDSTPVIFKGGKKEDIGKLIFVEIEKTNRSSLFGVKKDKTENEVAA